MHRLELRRLAESKLEDALYLSNGHRFASAYYLAGYAVEFGLKACIARRFSADEIPDKRFVSSIYEHDLTKLVGVAGLAAGLKENRLADEEFDAKWGIVSQWRTDSRYETMGVEDASLLVWAVADGDHGVLEWIKRYW